MSAKSIHEADGKALLACFLPQSPVYSAIVPAETFKAGLPQLASLTFPDEASVDAVLDRAEATYPWLLTSDARFVAKPDQLIKRRGKSGLLALNKSWAECRQWISQRAARQVEVEGIAGYLRTFLVEPFVPHDQSQEYYINIHSVREGDWILFYHEGGVDVGDVDAKASKLLIPVDIDNEYPSNDAIKQALLSQVPTDQHATLLDFINRLYAVYVDLQFTYLEINPLVVIPTPSGVQVHYLDLAAKIDQTAEFECGPKWAIARSPAALGQTVPASSEKVSVDAGPAMVFPAPFGRELSSEEAYIAELDSKTGASLKLTVLNASGRIWTLVAGGGASVVYADAIASAGYASELANYGEYSGAPNETQTFEYAKTVLDLMTRSDPAACPEGKILFIGGGIANFTQVGSTFKGIIRAFRAYQDKLHSHKVRIFVRRGGPNWQEGLRLIVNAGKELDLNLEAYGPDMHVSGIVPLALLGKKPKGILPFGAGSITTNAGTPLTL
ncbi:glutathione synthetase ATP-binding domain-like protein [Nadsonia fulvescens var. elongata DSM 6958]|uniref:ATP citrate synthase n=1 Tax=Nadsonia fulvescens var. elongata DSM 6958 TaxID=857566 RepID=A0A1E3PMD6_9ASCO|nr:glutathione synthetase ATP-binding domain-like protein [Nadsonia fulvescens var. elongata DSM 6958]